MELDEIPKRWVIKNSTLNTGNRPVLEVTKQYRSGTTGLIFKVDRRAENFRGHGFSNIGRRTMMVETLHGEWEPC